MKLSFTIFILYLSWCHEDPVLHLHSSSGAVVRPVELAILAQLSQDLCGFQWVPPHVVTMATGKRKSGHNHINMHYNWL